MFKPSISFLVLFVISLSADPAHSLDISQGISARGSLIASAASGFDGKIQRGSFFELSNTLAGDTAGADLTVGYHSAGAGDLAGGYGYRGYSGVHIFLSGERYWTPGGRSRSTEGAAAEIRPGLGFGAGGFFSVYEHTDILFFYPALRLTLFSDIFFPASSFSLRYGLPLEVYFRKDLASSFSLGFGVWGIMSWKKLFTHEKTMKKEAGHG
jgi:hypothetical protein